MELSAKIKQNCPSNIVSIEIENLFGQLTYKLPNSFSEQQDISNLFILYGDNGSGKTTILRLIYSLLSHFEKQGHKSFVSRTPFKKFKIIFNNKIQVTASRPGKELIGPYKLEIAKGSKILESQTLKTNEEFGVRMELNPHLPRLLEKLSQLNITYYFLTDRRHLECSRQTQDFGIGRKGERIIIERSLQKELFDDFPDNFPAEVMDIQDLELYQSISRVENWFQQQSFQGSSDGHSNANEIFMEVLRQLGKQKIGKKDEKILDFNKQFKIVEELKERSETFKQFDIPTTTFPAEDIIEVLKKASPTHKETISNILTPYLEGIKARLNSLQEFRDHVSLFTETINSFFTRKFATYSLKEGLTITTSNNERLQPHLLSSGERHLLLILCNAIVARDFSSIFLIDEPELSLNIKWQRQLLGTLLKLSEGSQGQFILATHSIELLSQHEKNVVQLIDEGKN